MLVAKHADPQVDSSALGGEIDQLVYRLYGLTLKSLKVGNKAVLGKFLVVIGCHGRHKGLRHLGEADLASFVGMRAP